MALLFIQILLIAASLAMDSLSVSIAGGMKSRGSKTRAALKVAVFFGGFQAMMPVIGWLAGTTMQGFISSIDHWIAFILLSFIGIKIVREAVTSEKTQGDITNTKTLILLALATSIDALVVGITLPLVDAPLLLSISIIGSVTFILTFLGYLLGKKLGVFFGKKIEVLGGIVLVIIGLKILLEHL